MEFRRIADKLEQDFGLKENHIRIIEALNEKNLTADEICQKTKIPKGRVYDFLNELIERHLVQKEDGRPSLYGIKDLKQSILDFLKYEFENNSRKESELLSLLSSKEDAQKIELIDNREKYDLEMISLLSKGKSFKIMLRQLSLSWFIFPRDIDAFLEIRTNINKRRRAASSTREEYSIPKYRAYCNVYESGRPIEYIMTDEALAEYVKMLREEYGIKHVREWASDIVKELRRFKNVKIWIIPNHYSVFTTQMSEKEVISALIHAGLLSAMKIRSPEVVKLYEKSFDEMKDKSKQIQEYLRGYAKA